MKCVEVAVLEMVVCECEYPKDYYVCKGYRLLIFVNLSHRVDNVAKRWRRVTSFVYLGSQKAI
jgi:hypothetical protein